MVSRRLPGDLLISQFFVLVQTRSSIPAKNGIPINHSPSSSFGCTLRMNKRVYSRTSTTEWEITRFFIFFKPIQK
jgi:hypothetical protein